MTTQFKPFDASDISIQLKKLHEAIPLTGSILSGTYSPALVDNNIKNPDTGLYQQCYDYPYLSSSANHIVDLTMGFGTMSWCSASAPTDGDNPQQQKKINMYNLLALTLSGVKADSFIKPFHLGLDTSLDRMDEIFALNFARLLTKDEIQKASFSIGLLTGGVCTTVSPTDLLLLQDLGADTTYLVNSPAGEVGLLYTSSAAQANGAADSNGLIFYQAGICILSASVFDDPSGSNAAVDYWGDGNPSHKLFLNINDALTGSQITASCDAFRNRISNISFNNTTMINSANYWVRANHNEFNFSSNPTYLSGALGGSQVRVKGTDPSAPSTVYITSVGLFNGAGELMAVAKVSPAIQKQDNEVLLKVMLNF
jgi:hypothetical protein